MLNRREWLRLIGLSVLVGPFSFGYIQQLSKQEIANDHFADSCEKTWEVWRDELYAVMKEI